MGLYPEHYEQLNSTLEPTVDSTCAQVLKWTNFTQQNGSFFCNCSNHLSRKLLTIIQHTFHHQLHKFSNFPTSKLRPTTKRTLLRMFIMARCGRWNRTNDWRLKKKTAGTEAGSEWRSTRMNRRDEECTDPFGQTSLCTQNI